MQNSKKKIIIIGPVYPYRGGPSTFLSYLYKTFSDRFEFKIYNYKLLYPSILFPGKTQYDERDRKSTRLNSSHVKISYAVFCLKKKKKKKKQPSYRKAK